MKILASDHEEMHGIMVGRGMPSALQRCKCEITIRDLSACTHPDTRPIPPTTQGKWLSSTMMQTRGDWIMLIGTRRDPDLVSCLGMEFLARCLRECIANPGRQARPLWHQVMGGWNDRLRDDHKWRAEQGNLGALILGGVTVDCQGDKLEKVRDLVEMHSGIPRVLLVSGGDPYIFCMDRLNRRPDRVAYVNRSHSRADRQQG